MLVLGLAGAAAAQEPPRRFVDVAQVSGRIDPVLADFVAHVIDEAQRDRPEVLILQLDSPGTFVDRSEIEALVEAMEGSEVPVAVWVGQTGAEANGDAGLLVAGADVAGMSTRSEVELDGRSYDPAEALEAGIVDLNQEESAVLGTFIAALDGHEAKGRTIDTAEFEEQDDGPPEAELTVQTRLAKLDLWPRLMHSFASPPVAYLLLLAGLVLLVFELFTGGVGIAGGVGAGSLVLASYGLAVLPTDLVGLALVVVAMFGFAVDVQTGVPRVWTGIGTVALVVGSLLLYDDGIRLSWLTLAGGIVSVLLLVLGGLPATVRSRFSTPTIGRESMIGEIGEAVAPVRPDGVVRIRGALWPAHTSRTTPLAAGDRVRVVGIDGPLLQVEPIGENQPLST